MSRTTQRQRIHQQKPPTPRKFTQTEIMGKIQREVKRRMVADGHIVDPAQRVKPEWHWAAKLSARDCYPRGGTVNADSRSEAKAAIKKQIGIKGRLPDYIVIVEPSRANSR